MLKDACSYYLINETSCLNVLFKHIVHTKMNHALLLGVHGKSVAACHFTDTFVAFCNDFVATL